MEENIYIKDFAKRLNELRQNKHISARDMSISLGQSHNFIHNIESHKNFPTMLNFYYICDFLKVTPRDFFDYEQKNIVSQDLLNDMSKLDKNQLKLIHQTIKALQS